MAAARVLEWYCQLCELSTGDFKRTEWPLVVVARPMAFFHAGDSS